MYLHEMCSAKINSYYFASQPYKKGIIKFAIFNEFLRSYFNT